MKIFTRYPRKYI